MSPLTPTAEQEHALALYGEGRSLSIRALAGTGKTSTIGLLASATPRARKALYTAFNRKIVDEAKTRFAGKLAVRTNHSLAWGVGSEFQNANKLDGRLNVMTVLDRTGWTRDTFGGYLDAHMGTAMAIQAIDRFSASDDAQVSIAHAHLPKGLQAMKPAWEGEARRAIADAAGKLWKRMVDLKDDMPVTHDTYLKVWCLRNPRLPYDTIIIDEAQDLSGAFIGLLQAQQHAQRVIVGDDYQAIYAWRGAVSAMQKLPCERTCTLTQSFRFGHPIAEAANQALEHLARAKLRLRGFDAISSRVGEVREPRTVIARTNAALLAEIMDTVVQSPAERLAVVGGVTDMIRLVEGAIDLIENRSVRCPELLGFVSYEQLVEISRTEAGAKYARLVEAIETHRPERLLSTLRNVAGNEANEDAATRIFTTAHRSKGLEWDTVRLCDDFPIPTLVKPERGPAQLALDREEANVLYVALTRARRQLDATRCGAFAITQDFARARSPGNAPGAPPASAPVPQAAVRSQFRLPDHWVLDTRQLPVAAQERLARRCHDSRQSITDVVAELLLQPDEPQGH